MNTGADTSDDRSSARPARRRRLITRRRVAIALPIVLLCLLVAGWWTVTRSALVHDLAIRRIESAVGCDASCDAVRLSLDGRLALRGVTLRVPGMASEAGEFLTAETAFVVLDLSQLIAGGDEPVRAIELTGARVRLSQSPDLRLNIEGLSPDAGATVAPPRIPNVRLTDATLELGEHVNGVYNELTAIAVDGIADTDPRAPTTVRFSLVEDGAPTVAGGAMTLAGSYDLRTLDGDAALTNVDLTRWGEVPAPRRFRQLWSDLSLRGTVDRARLTYTQDAGLAIAIDLTNVDMDLPLTGRLGEALPDAEARAIDLRTVDGALRFRTEGFVAELRGRIADLPVRVDFQADGYGEDAPFRTSIASTEAFVFERRPSLLPFAPQNVRQLFERLASPTAEVDGAVSLVRLEPGGGITVEGVFSLRDGFVRYEAFPYPISDVTVQLEFDNESVTIGSINGAGPTGAQFIADGSIAPLGEDAVLTLNANLFELPIDNHFRAALPEGARAIVSQLLHRPTYNDLLARGLVISSATRDELLEEQRTLELDRARAARGDGTESVLDIPQIDARLAHIRDRLDTPVFDLGGTVELGATIEQTFGAEPRFAGEISGRVVRVAALAQAFPYAGYLQDASIVVDDWTARVEGDIRGITGGRATLSANVPQIDRTDRTEKSAIVIDVHSGPIDEFLFVALPGPDAFDRDTPFMQRGDARAIARKLGPTGTVTDFRVVIAPRPGTGDLGFDITQTFDGRVTLVPPGSSLGARLDEGEIHITERNLDLTLVSGDLEGQPVNGAISVTYGSGRETGVRGRIGLPAIDLTMPVEGFFDAIAPEAVASASEARAKYEPQGTADVSVLLSRGPGDASGVAFSSGRDIALTALGGRIGIERLDGSAFTNGRRLVFDSIRDAPLTFRGEPAGALSAQGVFTPDPSEAPDPLELSLADARVESPLTRRVIRERSDALDQWLTRHNARGLYDVGLRRAHNDGELRGWLVPRELTIDRRGETLPIDFEGGRVSFDRTSGRLDGLDATLGTWRVDLDGTWSTDNGGTVALALGARGEELTDEALAALPEQLAGVLANMELDVGAGFAMDDAKLTIDRAFTDDRLTAFTGTLRFNDASLRTGLTIDNIAGAAAIDLLAPFGADVPTAEIEIDATSLDVQGVTMDRGIVRMSADPETGLLRMPEIRFTGHGGTIAGFGAFDLRAPDGAPRLARLRFDASGLAFSTLYNDLLDDIEADEALRSGSRQQTGTLEGSFSMHTPIGGTGASAIGRGFIRVQSGEFVEMPGVLPLLELSNLRIPTGERLESGYADFHIAGDRLVFDELFAHSPSLVIAGRGHVTIPKGDLDLRFTTRATNEIPFISDVLEGVRDEIVTSRLVGTLRKPVWRLEQLPATRRFLATIFASQEQRQEASGTESGVAPSKTDGEDGEQ